MSAGAYDERSFYMGVLIGIRLACFKFGRSFWREVGL